MPFAMCQHAALASAALHFGRTLVAIAAWTFSGVATEPSASFGLQVEHSATYDTLPAVNTALESHGPSGGAGGVKTVCQALFSSKVLVGSYWFVSGPAVVSAISDAAAMRWFGFVRSTAHGDRNVAPVNPGVTLIVCWKSSRVARIVWPSMPQ